MMSFLSRVLDVLLAFFKWRGETSKRRSASVARRAVRDHDAREMNRILQKMRDGR